MKYLFLAAGIVLMPIVASAATYHYVNTQGVTAIIEAPTAAEAINLAVDRHPESGVALDMGIIEPGTDVLNETTSVSSDSGIQSEPLTGTGGSNTFHYVTVNGFTASVTAPNPETALLLAVDRHPESGVAIDMGVIEPGTKVESVSN